jgi:hypothetical protein
MKMCPFVFMRMLLSAYRLISILSLDVVAGAVCCALFFSHVLGVQIFPYGFVALALSVWIIYTVDHLRDARKIGASARAVRHQFHYRNRRLLTWLVLLATIGNVITIVFIRKQVLLSGLVLGLIILLYLLLNQRLRFLKELFVAILYTCGVTLPAMAVAGYTIDGGTMILVIQLVLVAWANLLVFSYFDFEQDSNEGQTSFAVVFGQLATRSTVVVVALIHLLLSIFSALLSELIFASLTLFVMNAFLLLILLFGKKNVEWARCAVFFLPGVYWLWHQL